MSNYDQYYTPLEKGYMTGLSMGQGDSITLGELDKLLSNSKLDPEFSRGLYAGKQAAIRIRYAMEQEEIKDKASMERDIKEVIQNLKNEDFGHEHEL